MDKISRSSLRGSLRACASRFFRPVAAILLAGSLVSTPLAWASNDGSKSGSVDPKSSSPDPVLSTMQGELARAKSSLSKSEQPPYYLSYTVYDQDLVVIVGSYGSLLTDAALRRRQADVVMRVGSPALDNTHGQSRPTGMTSGTLPIGDDSNATARVLWELTDREYKRAAPAFLNVKTNNAVRAEEEDKSPDFSKETPVTHAGAAITPPPFASLPALRIIRM